VLTFSVIVGNAEPLMKMVGFQLGDKPLRLDDTVVTVHTQAAFVIKSFFFTYIGLMLAPPWSLLFLGVVVGASLLATRLPVVMLIARAPEYSEPERRMVSIALPRGMAAGVLATLPASARYRIEGTEDLPAMVFAAVVTSIAIFAVGFRKVRSTAGNAVQAGATVVQADLPVDPALLPPGAEPALPPSGEPAMSPSAELQLPAGAMPDGHLPSAVAESSAAESSGDGPTPASPPIAPPGAMPDGHLPPAPAQPAQAPITTLHGMPRPPLDQLVPSSAPSRSGPQWNPPQEPRKDPPKG